MKKLKVQGFTIEYNKETEQDAKVLKQLFITNSLFFLDLLKTYPIIRIGDIDEPLQDDITLEVSSLDEFKEILAIILPSYIEKLNIKDDEESLMTFLRILLTTKYSDIKDKDLSIKKNELPIYIESIYSLIALAYYESPKEAVNALVNLDEQEKKKLFNYLNDTYRIDLVNELIDEQIKYLSQASEYKNQDNFIIENIDELLKHTTEEMLSIDLSNQHKKEIPPLTEEQLNKLIVEFLIKVDPSLKWLKEYEELKNKNKIKKNKMWNCDNENGNWVINVSLTHTLEDFRSFIHEFIHYITVKDQKQESLPIALKEFPSIYFETLALKFLEEKGYDKEVIDFMLSERNEWTEENVYNLYLLLGLISNYIKNGCVTVKNELLRRCLISKELKDKIPEELSFFHDYSEKEINYSFDIFNGYMTAYPESIYEEYPYITGTYLADRAVEVTVQDPMFIYDMLSITDNLSTTNPNDVITLINQKHKQLIKKHETI